jgi:hypothetical protein
MDTAPEMSEKYIAKKYVAVGSVVEKLIKCPNCYQPMTIADSVIYCRGNIKCKLKDIPYREVKSLTTIERVDNFRSKT